MSQFLYDYQYDAVNKMHNGCILNGGVGSGKSRTALYYYFTKFGGKVPPNYQPMTSYKPLYIITTARKRDTLEWVAELHPFLISEEAVVIDSWNNIQKYTSVKDAFFIFDEQRVVGWGVWSKSFVTISKSNEWILLSATPGDTWMDYIPVFVANGFYKNKTDFIRQHVQYDYRCKNFPKVSGYTSTGKLIKYRKMILVDMDYHRKATPHHENVYVSYDVHAYHDIFKNRWNKWKDEPIATASELCLCLRRVVNSDESRQVALLEIFEDHPKLIIFYNFDYELYILKSMAWGSDVEIAEWNGHKHQDIPRGATWIYLVQYTAGAEGWNCITTDTVVFFSQSYSYKAMVQASGRIDRLNSPYSDLYYYHLQSRSTIDVAINRSLSAKKEFNTREFADKFAKKT